MSDQQAQELTPAERERMQTAYINAADGHPSEPHFRTCEHADEQHEAFTAAWVLARVQVERPDEDEEPLRFPPPKITGRGTAKIEPTDAARLPEQPDEGQPSLLSGTPHDDIRAARAATERPDEGETLARAIAHQQAEVRRSAWGPGFEDLVEQMFRRGACFVARLPARDPETGE